jgi:hypothetical protein
MNDYNYIFVCVHWLNDPNKNIFQFNKTLVDNYQLKRRRNQVNKLITNLVKDIGQLGEKFASQATLAKQPNLEAEEGREEEN